MFSPNLPPWASTQPYEDSFNSFDSFTVNEPTAADEWRLDHQPPSPFNSQPFITQQHLDYPDEHQQIQINQQSTFQLDPPSSPLAPPTTTYQLQHFQQPPLPAASSQQLHPSENHANRMDPNNVSLSQKIGDDHASQSTHTTTSLPCTNQLTRPNHSPIAPVTAPSNSSHHTHTTLTNNHLHSQPQPSTTPAKSPFEFKSAPGSSTGNTPAIVLNVNGVYALPAMGFIPNSSMVINSHHSRVRAVCACIRCRKLKASCDNQRPCSRCVVSGNECLDRSEEEVKNAQPHKKRPLTSEPAPAAVVSTPVPTASSTSNSVRPKPSTPLTKSHALPFSTWSREFLTLLIQSGIRDSILKIQAQFDLLPVELPNLLEWHSQVSFMCSHFADQMTAEDFHQFLTHGLSEDILNSRLWSSSPFAPWSKLSTRPFFVVWSSLPPSAATPPNHPCTQPSDVAELYFEFAPSSNLGYSRFLQMQTARIMFERELSNGRIRKQPPSTNLAPPRSNGSQFSSGSSTSSVSEPSPDSSGDSDMTALENSMSSFSFLDISTSLAAPPPTHLIENEEERGSLHANWCPMSRTSADSGSESSGANKLTRTNLIDSVHGTSTTSLTSANLDQIPLSDLLASNNPSFRCICSLSTPLPATIRTNAAFERLFGWRRIEIEQEMQCEGSSFMRNLVPASFHAVHKSHSINHWKSQILYIGEMALQAAYLTQLESAGQSTADLDLPPILPPEPWLPQTVRICRKSGEIDPQLYLEHCVLLPSDGQSAPTTTIIRWKKLVN